MYSGGVVAEDQSTENKSKTMVELERARETAKLRLWQSRIAFIKRGNEAMQKKIFSEAAISYEKYLKILEMIYDCGTDGLTPEMFKESARTTELSVLASVYWDLVRIYDGSDTFAQRQKKASEKLALFVPLTPLYVDILRKAQAFQKQSRHPDVIKAMITKCGKKKSRCFIATSAFESPVSVEVQILRHYRDEVLNQTWLGRQFIFYYYKHSPKFAVFLDKHEYLKAPVRSILRFFVKCVS